MSNYKNSMYKTAILLATNDYVAIKKFVPASTEFNHDDFFIIRTICGQIFGVSPDQLSNFCL